MPTREVGHYWERWVAFDFLQVSRPAFCAAVWDRGQFIGFAIEMPPRLELRLSGCEVNRPPWGMGPDSSGWLIRRSQQQWFRIGHCAERPLAGAGLVVVAEIGAGLFGEGGQAFDDVVMFRGEIMFAGDVGHDVEEQGFHGFARAETGMAGDVFQG